jgi:hypothetical protein
MYPLFRPLLNKGGAGRSLSREDTVEALNPLVDRHGRLLAAYDVAIRTLGDREAAQRIEATMNRSRTELAKLRETVLSNGGIPPTGIGLRDEWLDLGSNDSEILRNLRQREEDYRAALREALDYPHHQIRTIAILENNVTGSNERLDVLGALVDGASSERQARPAPVDEVTEHPADLEHTVQHDDPDEQPAALRAEKSSD